MTRFHRTHVPGDTPKVDESREPVLISDVLAEALPEVHKRVRRSGPVGATLSIPLSPFSETTLGDLRDLLDLAERLPDSDVVNVHVPLDPREHGSIAIIVGGEVRA